MMDESKLVGLLDQIEQRCTRQREMLKEKHPEVFKDQNHLNTDSMERAYWHYGYSAALFDVLTLIRGASNPVPTPVFLTQPETGLA